MYYIIATKNRPEMVDFAVCLKSVAYDLSFFYLSFNRKKNIGLSVLKDSKLIANQKFIEK